MGAIGYHSWTPVSRPGTSEIEDQLKHLSQIVEEIGSPNVMGMVRWLPYDPMNHLHDGEVKEVLQPWLKLENGKYDLEKFEPKWENRFRDLLSLSLKLNIAVFLEVWDDWSVTRGPGGAFDPESNYGWNGHPFNPNNNVNYEASVLPASTLACQAPFYNTLPEKGDNKQVLDLQKRYVDHLLGIVMDYPHVLLNINNESRADLIWSRYWAKYIHEKTNAEILIGDMPSTNRKDGGGECEQDFNPMTLCLDPLYQTVDIAQGISGHEFNSPKAQALEGGKRIRAYREAMVNAGHIKPLIVSKDYTRDQNGGDMVIWSRFINGTASTRFHRPAGDHPLSIIAYQHAAMQRLGEFVAKIPFWEMKPMPEIISSLSSGTGANVLANPDKLVVIQLIDSEKHSELGLVLPKANWKATWIDPSTGRILGNSQTVFKNGKVTLNLPFQSEHLVVMLEKD